MKALSTIIAIILLVLITIGLAGSAYVFLGGILARKMEKVISILDANCNGTHITMVVSNDGIETIAADEIQIYVNNVNVGNFGQVLDPREAKVNITESNVVRRSMNKVIVTSPSNSILENVWCP